MPSLSFPQVKLTAELCPQQTYLEALIFTGGGWGAGGVVLVGGGVKCERGLVSLSFLVCSRARDPSSPGSSWL